MPIVNHDPPPLSNLETELARARADIAAERKRNDQEIARLKSDLARTEELLSKTTSYCREAIAAFDTLASEAGVKSNAYGTDAESRTSTFAAVISKAREQIRDNEKRLVSLACKTTEEGAKKMISDALDKLHGLSILIHGAPMVELSSVRVLLLGKEPEYAVGEEVWVNVYSGGWHLGRYRGSTRGVTLEIQIVDNGLVVHYPADRVRKAPPAPDTNRVRRAALAAFEAADGPTKAAFKAFIQDIEKGT